jgi:tetratricopeptide (TPR) repeat protein
VSIESLFAEAYAAHQRGDFARAERGYRGLIRSKPLEAQHNLGLVLGAVGRFEAAEAAFRAALAAQPNPGSRYALAELLLADGRYAEGWPLWEARRELPALKVPSPALAFPEWRGEALTGKRLLVFAEQGLGDSIMLARYFAPLQAAGAQIVFFCPPELHRLMAGLGVAVVGADPDPEAVRADYWTLTGSLPARLATTLETLPPPAEFNGPALGSGGGIGVATQGSATHRNDVQRSLAPRQAQRLLKLGRDLAPAATGATDFEDTAAIVADLDLVISVDTSVVHLAASMGKPVWVLLPARDTDWRWLRAREDSPWYPSVRLFRQRVAGDWEPVLRRVETAAANR